MQDCNISIANALETLQSCTKPLMYSWHLISKPHHFADPFQWTQDLRITNLAKPIKGIHHVYWVLYQTWWRHQMETFSALLAICAGNSPVPGEFPTQRPVTRSFDVYFDLRPNKRLSKQSWGWWFKTLSSPLWRHRNSVWQLNNTKALNNPAQHCAVAE